LVHHVYIIIVGNYQSRWVHLLWIHLYGIFQMKHFQSMKDQIIADYLEQHRSRHGPIKSGRYLRKRVKMWEFDSLSQLYPNKMRINNKWK